MRRQGGARTRLPRFAADTIRTPTLSTQRRGHSRALLFSDDGDRRRFLAGLAYDVDEFGIRLYAYCLHYHLVLETPLASVSAFMHGPRHGAQLQALSLV